MFKTYCDLRDKQDAAYINSLSFDDRFYDQVVRKITLDDKCYYDEATNTLHVSPAAFDASIILEECHCDTNFYRSDLSARRYAEQCKDNNKFYVATEYYRGEASIGFDNKGWHKVVVKGRDQKAYDGEYPNYIAWECSLPKEGHYVGD